MTVLSSHPHRRYSHASFRTHVGDPEPTMTELLDDPILLALMASDGVVRSELERLIGQTRLRIGPGDEFLYATLEARLLLECA